MKAETYQIVLIQDDLDEIADMTDPQEIKDYLTMLILSQVSNPLEAMSPTYTPGEMMH
jgi:hypothetical protein